jgi:diadenylate cyclase
VVDFLTDLLFSFQRFTWLSLLDILLVATIFFGLLYLVRDTQAMILLRGIFLLGILATALGNIFDLPAFRWLINTTLPALLLAIPVIFAPEIRRALGQLGRANVLWPLSSNAPHPLESTVESIVNACSRLSARKHGALIVLQRIDPLDDYIATGVVLNAVVTPELLLQIFYPNTPLHDGAVIIHGDRIKAASCVMPLSSSGILNATPDRQMGLRHRAALGISEATDAISVVVSEETGTISVAHNGRILRNLSSERLGTILLAFYKPLFGDGNRPAWIDWLLNHLLPRNLQE